MTSVSTLSLPGQPAGSLYDGVRQGVARGLRHIAEALSAAVQRLAPAARRSSRKVTLLRAEFDTEACAPEGAMTINGVPFGQLDSLRSE
jgi:hypothetical protein